MRAMLLFMTFAVQLCFFGNIYADEFSFVPTSDHAGLHVPKKNPLVLVVGCGRSGTKYMAKFLKASGLDVGHERMGKDGSVSWLMSAVIDWAPWGPLSKDYHFKHIFHQVRNPVKVIQSFYNVPPLATWEWIKEVIPEINLNDSNITKCAKYWVYWNLMSEKRAEWTYRIEDYDVRYKEMSKRLGRPLDPIVLSSISKKTNAKNNVRMLSWEILKEELDPTLFNQVRNLAIRYGYTVPS